MTENIINYDETLLKFDLLFMRAASLFLLLFSLVPKLTISKTYKHLKFNFFINSNLIRYVDIPGNYFQFHS